MLLFARLITGKTITLTIEPTVVPTLTCRKIKDLISVKESIHPDTMRLIYKGMTLELDRNITDYNIQNEATIIVGLPLRAGMFHNTSSGSGCYSLNFL